MTPERHAEIQAIFEAAVDLSEAVHLTFVPSPGDGQAGDDDLQGDEDQGGDDE